MNLSKDADGAITHIGVRTSRYAYRSTRIAVHVSQHAYQSTMSEHYIGARYHGTISQYDNGDRSPFGSGMRQRAPPGRLVGGRDVRGVRLFCTCRFCSVSGARRGGGSGLACLALPFLLGGRCAGERAGGTRCWPAFHRLKACRPGGSRAGGLTAGIPESSRARRMGAGRSGGRTPGSTAAGTPGTRRRPGSRRRPFVHTAARVSQHAYRSTLRERPAPVGNVVGCGSSSGLSGDGHSS